MRHSIVQKVMKSVSCWKIPRDEAAEKCPDARRVAIRGSVWSLNSFAYLRLPVSSLCQNGKQVEIITKMIFELCYIEAIAFIITTIETTIDCIATVVSIVVYIVLLYDRVVLK